MGDMSRIKITVVFFTLLSVVCGQKFKEQSCTNCVDEGANSNINSRFTMPLTKLGSKQYYLGIFFKSNWYKAEQYCRFHGMHLASINTAEEQRDLQDHIQAYGMGHEHFWTSGTDQGEEGKFFWMGTGKPITYTNWNAGEPNNFQYEDGEQEHCLEMWTEMAKVWVGMIPLAVFQHFSSARL